MTWTRYGSPREAQREKEIPQQKLAMWLSARVQAVFGRCICFHLYTELVPAFLFSPAGLGNSSESERGDPIRRIFSLTSGRYLTRAEARTTLNEHYLPPLKRLLLGYSMWRLYAMEVGKLGVARRSPKWDSLVVHGICEDERVLKAMEKAPASFQSRYWRYVRPQ